MVDQEESQFIPSFAAGSRESKIPQNSTMANDIELFLSTRRDQPIISTFQVVLKPQSTSGYRTHFFCGDELGDTLGHCGEIHGG